MGISIALIMFISLIKTCSEEVEARYRSELLETEERARSCHYKYSTNNCGPNLKGEIWQQMCREWDTCRQMNIVHIGRAKIATRVFGELIDRFIEPLTMKSMVIITLLVFGFFIISSLMSL